MDTAQDSNMKLQSTLKSEESDSAMNLVLSSTSFRFVLANVNRVEPNELAAALATLQTLSSLMVDTLKQRGVLHPLTELDWQLTPHRLTPKVKEIHLSASFLHRTTGSLKSTWRDTLIGPANTVSIGPSESVSRQSGQPDVPAPIGTLRSGPDVLT